MTSCIKQLVLVSYLQIRSLQCCAPLLHPTLCGDIACLQEHPSSCMVCALHCMVQLAAPEAILTCLLLRRLCLFELNCRGTADGRTGPAMLAMCAAKHWLARHAARVKLIRSPKLPVVSWTASACAGLVSCLPALEVVELVVPIPLDADDLSRGCLLVALAWCPCLKSLELDLVSCPSEDDDAPVQAVQPVTGVPAFAELRSLAQLRSLTKLALTIDFDPSCTLADVVDAVLPLTGL